MKFSGDMSAVLENWKVTYVGVKISHFSSTNENQ
jgi:hypothetical protein